MTNKRPQSKGLSKPIKRYLLFAGITLIGVPLWEFILEEIAFKEVDLFFPGDSDVYIGGIHFIILGVFHFTSGRIESSGKKD